LLYAKERGRGRAACFVGVYTTQQLKENKNGKKKEMGMKS
jgi:hypothetical protein